MNYNLKNYDTTKLQTSPLNKEFICKYKIIPLELKMNMLHIGVARPLDQFIVDNISLKTGLRIYPIIVSEESLNLILKPFCNVTEKPFALSLSNIAIDDTLPILTNHALHNDEPLIKFVNEVIDHAIAQSASDIHIEPFENSCRIRYRRDGILYEITHTPVALASRIAARLKIMARLDIAEKRLPQDGRFHFSESDIRINICPTMYGEKIVLRLLNPNKGMLNLHDLGLSKLQQELFISKISEPHGLILVTGPTGSGKTITLYSALNYLNNIEKNIATVEDPIEIQLAGINQTNIQPKIGLDFDTILHSLLRQDPDILMIGEIRDKKTANIAIQAAHTGHLVFSTLHTRSAIETIQRLATFKIHPINLVSATILIIAQRLIRRLCENCKLFDNSTSTYQPVGCKHCLNGYHGRTGIYELLPFTQAITELILSATSPSQIKHLTKNHGFTSLSESAKQKLKQGLTSLDEIRRVLHNDT